MKPLRQITAEQKSIFKTFKSKKGKPSKEDKQMLIDLYAHIFALQYFLNTLTEKDLKSIINELTEVYEAT